MDHRLRDPGPAARPRAQGPARTTTAYGRLRTRGRSGCSTPNIQFQRLAVSHYARAGGVSAPPEMFSFKVWQSLVTPAWAVWLLHSRCSVSKLGSLLWAEWLLHSKCSVSKFGGLSLRSHRWSGCLLLLHSKCPAPRLGNLSLRARGRSGCSTQNVQFQSLAVSSYACVGGMAAPLKMFSFKVGQPLSTTWIIQGWIFSGCFLLPFSLVAVRAFSSLWVLSVPIDQ